MGVQLEKNQGVRLAIEGCGHGTLHAIYASIAEACNQKGWTGVDLLIIGGDFQAVRNAYDLNCVSMPAKYREMCDFHEYYSGQRTAPYLTVFVGGNHEASNYLFELYYGGWVAPNIYYMGAANILRLGPLRIVGMSGIWKGYNYRKPHFERLPYNESDMKSIYHVRELDVRKLLQIRTQVDIGVSHDWPNGTEWKGNWKQLFRFKPHLEEDAQKGQLGSVAAQQVVEWLRPKWWFSAHLHCRYAAVIEHEKGEVSGQPLAADQKPKNDDEIELDDDDDFTVDSATLNGSINGNTNGHDSGATRRPILEENLVNGSNAGNADEIDLDLDEDDDASPQVASGTMISVPDVPDYDPLASARAALPESFRRPPKHEPEVRERPPEIANKTTHFLALDKCLPGKHFLQLMTIPSEDVVESLRPLKLQYDREWLAITRTFAIDEPLTLGDPDLELPKTLKQNEYQEMIDKRRLWINENIDDVDLVIPENFEPTAPVYDGGNWNLPQYSQVAEYPNPQTQRFCDLLQIPNPFDLTEEASRMRQHAGPRPDPDGAKFSRGRGRGGFGGRNRGSDRGRGRGGGGRGRFRGR